SVKLFEPMHVECRRLIDRRRAGTGAELFCPAPAGTNRVVGVVQVHLLHVVVRGEEDGRWRMEDGRWRRASVAPCHLPSSIFHPPFFPYRSATARIFSSPTRATSSGFAAHRSSRNSSSDSQRS